MYSIIDKGENMSKLNNNFYINNEKNFQDGISLKNVGFFKLIKLSKPKYSLLFVGTILLIITSGIQVYIPTLVAHLFNNFSNGIHYKIVIEIFILFAFSAIFSAMGGTILGIFGENVIEKLRKFLLKRILFFKLSYFDTVKSGEISSRISNDTIQMKQLLTDSIPQSIASIITILGTIYMMIKADWHMTLIIFLMIPVLIIIMFPIMAFGANIGNIRQKKLAQFNGIVNEIISGIRLVKASNAEKHAFINANKNIRELYSVGKKEALFDAIIQPVIMMIFMFAIFGILIYGLQRIATGKMYLGTLFSFIMYLFNLIGSLPVLATFFSEVAKVSGATNRIQELLKKEIESFDIGHNFNLKNQVLNVNHVDFSYSNSSKNLVLKDISFEAKPNQIIAFVGPSGGGKTTIFNLIERFYEPINGTIFFGDQNILDINLKYYRSQIGLVSQEVTIMSGTIRDNLIYGLDREVSEDELWFALKLSYADQFVKGMPQQLDTEVGERGVKISGGQRQRLAIARAFLRNPNLLMLDEATANLDSESETKIQQALANLMVGRTTLIIAHRLSTIVNSDCIYFIENGQITGFGKHEVLVNEHPLYASYVSEQFNL